MHGASSRTVRASGASSGHVAAHSFSLLTTSDRLARLAPRLGLRPWLRPPAQQAARVAVYLLAAWVLPMLLASVQGERPGALSFLDDYETHLRSLVAMPLLLFAETRIDPEVRSVVSSLSSGRRCRRPDELRARVRRLEPLTRHPLVGVVLLLLAFLVVPTWIREHTSGLETWIFQAAGDRRELTIAGIWQAWVVVPLYAFLLIRWLWRWIVLTLVFARSAPLVRPIVSHGDRCGGFSFVSAASATFAWVIAGASSLVAARWVSAVSRGAVTTQTVTNHAVAVVVLSTTIAFLPMTGFAFHFARAKRCGLRRYRIVLEGHARNIERAWSRRPYPALVSSEESSSLADLNAVYGCVRRMRVIPFRRRHLVVVALAAIFPMVPVFAMILPIDEIVREVLQALL